MQAIKTLETKNNTYYCGYISKYEQTEAEKEHRRYFIKQKAIGLTATIISIILVCCGAAPALLLTILGLAVTLTDQRVTG